MKKLVLSLLFVITVALFVTLGLSVFNYNSQIGINSVESSLRVRVIDTRPLWKQTEEYEASLGHK